MKKKNKIWLSFMLPVLLLTGCQTRSELYLEEHINVSAQEVATEIQSEQGERTEGTEQPDFYYVYLCGAVKKPGVYALPAGSRIFEAIAMAGGLREDADETFVNQAEIIADGMKIQIYTREETANGMTGFKSDVEDDDRIDLNTADIAKLMTLPGIGKTKAEAILAYRKEQGSFSKIEDLMQVSGIKEGTFLQIKEHIKVGK